MFLEHRLIPDTTTSPAEDNLKQASHDYDANPIITPI